MPSSPHCPPPPLHDALPIWRSSPANTTRPPTMRPAGSGTSRTRDRQVTDFPDPDSPTSASVSPACSVKLTPSTALMTPRRVKKRSEEQTSELQSPMYLVCRHHRTAPPLPYTTLFRSGGLRPRTRPALRRCAPPAREPAAPGTGRLPISPTPIPPPAPASRQHAA